jgi:hypothetical protein
MIQALSGAAAAVAVDAVTAVTGVPVAVSPLSVA